ncbi:MAG TPA: hypothetical protein VHY84_05895 [Bryobacteraceae bacterium]|jgi:hypothetical protein|nr:hypothetical protein [Bryobacteraceae bacterium]
MNTFLQILNALPTIIQSVQAVETAIPLPQSGKQKLDLILGAAGTAWEIGQVGQQISKTNTLQAIETLTNLTVASLNAAGVLKSSTPASVPAPAATTASAPATPVSSS